VQQHYPQVPEAQIQYLLQTLWENHFLLSDLRPPLTEVSPAHYLLEHIPDTSELGPVRETLKQVLLKIEHFDQAEATRSIAILEEIQHIQKTLDIPLHSNTGIQTDTALKLTSAILPRSIGEIASQAVQILLRQSRVYGMPHLHEYRMAFLEKYGPHAEVQLLELLDPGKGLGAPSGYQYPPNSSPFQLPGTLLQPPPETKHLSHWFMKH
jgi:hypothetical protein